MYEKDLLVGLVPGPVEPPPPGMVGRVMLGRPGTVTLLVLRVVKAVMVVNDPPGRVLVVVKTPPAVSEVETAGGRVGMTGTQTLFVNV